MDPAGRRVTSGVRESGPTAATASSWPPPAGLLDPRNDPRAWGRGLVAAEEDGEGLVVARGRMIHLRTLTRRDLTYLAEWGDDRSLEYLVGSDFLRAFREIYDKQPTFFDAVLADPTQIALMIVPNRSGDGKPVGVVRLFNIHVEDGYAGIETVVADAHASRRGFGVQASRLVAFYGVDVLGLRRIECKAYEYNALSINTLLRNGFTQEGVLRKAAFKNGRYWDIIIFGILRDEIEEQRRKDKYLLREGETPPGDDRSVSEPP